MIVHINSPGGTVAGSEQLFDSLQKVKEKKPLVVVVDGLAASGGYIAALAGDRIVAQQSATAPMKPPQNTKPPRLRKAFGSPVRTT